MVGHDHAGVRTVRTQLAHLNPGPPNRDIVPSASLSASLLIVTMCGFARARRLPGAALDELRLLWLSAVGHHDAFRR